MSTPSSFSQLPAPPYYAVIFSSRRTDGDNGYSEAADRMIELAASQRGFLGVESARGTDGFGITVSYWSNIESILAWRAQLEHRSAQESGKSMWYEHYEVRISRVERSYGKRQSA